MNLINIVPIILNFIKKATEKLSNKHHTSAYHAIQLASQNSNKLNGIC